MTTTRATLSVGRLVLEISASVVSDSGPIRSTNQDSFLNAPPIFVVADGMGGHRSGDLASQAAVRVLGERLADSSAHPPDAVLASLRAAHDAVAAIGEAGAVSGTTVAGVALTRADPSSAPHWMLFNIGDSRIYSWDGTSLSQVTVDHSAVQELIEAGSLSVQAASVHPERNVITRALGVGDASDPDVWLLPVADSQTFLICSDGLTKELGDDQIADVLVAARDDDAAQRLVDAAIAHGGHDNVTVLIVSCVAQTAADGSPPLVAGTEFLEDTVPRG